MPTEAKKDEIINRYLKNSAPKERECTICGDEYVGMRIICEKLSCEVGLKARVAHNRAQRPVDYVSVGRKVFLADAPPTEESR